MSENWHSRLVCALLAFFVSSRVTVAQQPVIEQISREFPLIAGPLTLFRIDDQFVLQPKFINGTLAAIRIVPKYFFSDEYPKWTESAGDRITISTKRYSALLVHLGKVRPIGASHGEVTRIRIHMNLYADSWEEFDSAVVLRGLYPPRGSPSCCWLV